MGKRASDTARVKPAIIQLAASPTLHRALATAVALALLPVFVFLGERALTTGKVLRGVWVDHAALSGLDRQATQQAVADLATEMTRRVYHVQVGSRLFEVRAKDLGAQVDTDATVDAVLNAGRHGSLIRRFRWWLDRWSSPSQIALVVSLDPTATRRWITHAEEGLEDPPFDGSTTLKGGKVTPVYPHPGRVVDQQQAWIQLVNALRTGQTGVVSLALATQQPHLDRTAVDAVVKTAQKLISGPVRLLAPDTDDEVVFEAEDLAAALATRSHVTPRPYLEVYFDANRLDSKLAPLRSQIERLPQNASFVVDKQGGIHVRPDRPGVRLDPRLVADAALYAAVAPGRFGVLPLDRAAQPELTLADARALGINERVSRFTTYYPCCQPRVENIHHIADLLDGTIVRPGETFSVNKTVGPRTKENGFVPAPTIEEGEMVDSVGGGISQFATTMFNAVLRGGYEIIERQPHSYYFSRYPEGHEATLSYPHPDLAFRNDTQAGMLIKCEYGKTHIRVTIYGNREGRKVKTTASKRRNIVQPPVEYIANPDLDPDEEEVEYGGQVGWTVTVTRTVVFADGKKKVESRDVTYSPRARRVQVHPCRIPEGEDGYTGEDCPVPEEDEDEDAGEEGEQQKTEEHRESEKGESPTDDAAPETR